MAEPLLWLDVQVSLPGGQGLALRARTTLSATRARARRAMASAAWADDGSSAAAAWGGSNPSTGTSTASSGDEGSGVGSGGTGVSTADATGVAQSMAQAASSSTACAMTRAPLSQCRGRPHRAPAGHEREGHRAGQRGLHPRYRPPGRIRRRHSRPADIGHLAQGSFVILGTSLTTDDATVWADAAGPRCHPAERTLQVWSLQGGPGVLRATRVEQREPPAPIFHGHGEEPGRGATHLHAWRTRRQPDSRASSRTSRDSDRCVCSASRSTRTPHRSFNSPSRTVALARERPTFTMVACIRATSLYASPAPENALTSPQQTVRSFPEF